MIDQSPKHGGLYLSICFLIHNNLLDPFLFKYIEKIEYIDKIHMQIVELPSSNQFLVLISNKCFAKETQK